MQARRRYAIWTWARTLPTRTVRRLTDSTRGSGNARSEPQVRHPYGSMRARLAVTPVQYRRIAYLTLAALTVIVLTGAAVRLTDSGLGCSSWPKCSGSAYPPLQTHALIE